MTYLTPAMKATLLMETVQTYFNNRIKTEYNRVQRPLDVALKTELTPKELRLSFTSIKVRDTEAPGAATYALNIPIPFEESSVWFLEMNNIRHAACNFLVKPANNELDFVDVMLELFCNDNQCINTAFSKSAPFLQKIVYSFVNDNASIIIYNIQKAIYSIVASLPLHKTNMSSWAMNQRLIILDENFNYLQNPADKLKYQIEKSKEYFPRGWTTIGLSDGVLSDKNYILKTSLRRTVPFGFRHHNPQRNLYSTLGMKGDDTPLIMSQSMKELKDKGIIRTGWNLLTVFVDIPDVWEDQIMIDKSLCEYYIEYDRRIQCFGVLKVKKGQELFKNDTLSISADNQHYKLDLNADKIWVDDIIASTTNVNGTRVPVHNVAIKFRRYIKEGVKITNLSANKGVVRVADLGYAIDPKTGEHRKIDVIVSKSAAKRRKNYGQILEANFNNIHGETELVLDDKISVTTPELEAQLEQAGYPKDGCWECVTYAGTFKAVVGKVFWGVTMDVEDQIWDEGETEDENNKFLRTAGLKFSTVELRALRTRFGKGNPITAEILSYAQGAGNLKDMLKVVESRVGKIDPSVPIVDVSTVSEVDQVNNIMVDLQHINGTIVDENMFPDGVYIKLPVKFQTMVDATDKIIHEGVPLPTNGLLVPDKEFTTDTIYIPNASLKRCWRHATGKYGLSELGTFINSIVIMSKRFLDNPDARNYLALYRVIAGYFHKVDTILGTKRGDISTYGMAVRYPFSAKGVATLSNDLPKNTVQIHEKTAKMLGVNEGEVVLVERFPCLGFMSLRPQKVTISKDPMNLYTIRVSGPSLASTSVDFDGDVIYLASFHTKEAKALLLKEWTNPNKSCYEAIKELNAKKGHPYFGTATLQDYNIEIFAPLTAESHAEIVSKATGVKSHTGPVIALAYNIMRVIENSNIKDSQKVNVAIEVFLDKVANSVFKQKHGVKSLHQIVTDAICTADVETLVKEGFKRSTSTIICDLIKSKAREVNIRDLKWYHGEAQKFGTTILNRIVRRQNKIYFASRANLNGIALLSHLNSEAVDVPSKIFKAIMSKETIKKTPLDVRYDERMGHQLKSEWARSVFTDLADCIDNMFGACK